MNEFIITFYFSWHIQKVLLCHGVMLMIFLQWVCRWVIGNGDINLNSTKSVSIYDMRAVGFFFGQIAAKIFAIFIANRMAQNLFICKLSSLLCKE